MDGAQHDGDVFEAHAECLTGQVLIEVVDNDQAVAEEVDGGF